MKNEERKSNTIKKIDKRRQKSKQINVKLERVISSDQCNNVMYISQK